MILTFDLASRGQDIHVITGGQLYTDPGAALLSEEVICGVQGASRTHLAFRASALVGPDARLHDILSRCHLAFAPIDRAG